MPAHPKTTKAARPPVAIFAYRRPRHLSKMLHSLQRCEGFHETSITIFVDGAQTTADERAVAQTIRVARDLALANIRIVARSENFGLKRSIHAGVSELCASHGEVIVFEDDFELSPITLNFFRDALEKYRDIPRVWSVNAYMYNLGASAESNRALVLPWATPWGWATWERAWSQFIIDRPIPLELFRSRTFRHFFDLGGLRDFTDMLQLSRDGLINSWYIQWYWKIFEAGGVSIFPPRSLVKNTGIGTKGATHGSFLNPYRLLSMPDRLLTTAPALPDTLAVDWLMIDRMITSWDARLQRIVSRLGRLKRRIKEKIGT